MNRASPAADIHCTLCSSALASKPSSVGDASVEIAKRIGYMLLFEREVRAFRAPARAAAEIAAAVERQHGRVFEGRRIIGRRGMRQVMLHHQQPAVGETARAAWDRSPDLGTGRATATASTCSGLAPASCRQVAMECSGKSPVPPQFKRRRTSFDSSTAATNSPSLRMAVAASPSMPPIPRMIIWPCRFSILAHVSRSATVRLKTGFPGVLSGSAQK